MKKEVRDMREDDEESEWLTYQLSNLVIETLTHVTCKIEIENIL